MTIDQNKKLQEENTVTCVLIKMLLNGFDYCPYEQGKKIDEKYLYIIASRNKLIHVLDHCLRCITCSRHISIPMMKKLAHHRMQTVAHLLIYKMERKKFQSFLKQQHIHAVEFKRSINERATERNIFSSHRSADLDVLVSSDDAINISARYSKMGYKKKTKGEQKELQLINTASGFEIDLHFLLAYPHYGNLSSTEYAIVEQFTQTVLANSTSGRFGITYISLEYFILSSCMRYWYNDMLCGLYPLYKLMQFCYTQRTKIRWEQVFQLAEKYAMRNEMLFILELGNRIFGTPLPKEVMDNMTFRIKYTAFSITMQDIAIFPPITKWCHKRFRDISHKKYTKFFILKTVINQRTPLLRCIRPRILAFAFLSLCRHILHFKDTTRSFCHNTSK